MVPGIEISAATLLRRTLVRQIFRELFTKHKIKEQQTRYSFENCCLSRFCIVTKFLITSIIVVTSNLSLNSNTGNSQKWRKFN